MVLIRFDSIIHVVDFLLIVDGVYKNNEVNLTYLSMMILSTTIVIFFLLIVIPILRWLTIESTTSHSIPVASFLDGFNTTLVILMLVVLLPFLIPN